MTAALEYDSYSHASTATCTVCSEEEDLLLVASTEFSSSASEVAHLGYRGILQYQHWLREDLVSEGDRCCCVATEELTSESTDQPLVGWEKRKIACQRNNQRPISQASERSIAANAVAESASKGSSSGGERLSKSSMSRTVINLGSDSKSSLRSYIYSTPTIPFTFQHHLDGDTAALYMEEYRNSYTYPNMDKRNSGTSSPRSSTPALVKPTLFMMDNVRVPLQRLESTSILRQRLNLLGITGASGHSSRKLAPSKHRELGVPKSGKECHSVWNTGAVASSRPQQSNFSEALNIEGLGTSDTYVSGKYATPQSGVLPITHVKPQSTKSEIKQLRRVNTPRKPQSVKTIVVHVDSLPVATVHSSQNIASRTVAGTKIKGHSSNHLSQR